MGLTAWREAQSATVANDSPFDNLDEHLDLMVTLQKLLAEHFSDDEMRTLTFHLGIAYDDLPGDGRKGKARELVLLMERKRQLRERCLTLNEIRKMKRLQKSLAPVGD